MALEKKYNIIWKRKLKHSSNQILVKGSREWIGLKLLDNGQRLLDIGCGNGILCHFAKEKYTETYGIDFSETALDYAIKLGINVKKVDLNSDKIPFHNNYFDAITCLDIIEHIFDPSNLIQDIKRVLKISGILIISTPNIRFWKNICTLIIKGTFPKTSEDSELYDGGHIHYFTFSDIKKTLKENNFKILISRGTYKSYIFKEFLSKGIFIKAKLIK